MAISVTTSDQYNLSVVLNDGNTVNLTTTATSVAVTEASPINVTVSSKGPKGDSGTGGGSAGVSSVNANAGDIVIQGGTDNVSVTDNGSGTISISVEDSTFLYTNEEAMPEAVGGWDAGSTFNAKTLQQMFDGLLYPYQDPTLTVAFSPTDTEFEVGYTIGVQHPGRGVSVAFTNRQNLQANSLDISIDSNQDGVSQTLDTGNAIPSNGVFSQFYNFEENQISLDFNKYLRFKATATNTLEETVTGFSGSIRWKYKMYWGQSSNETLTQAQIKSLSYNDLITTTTGSYTFDEGTEGTPLYVYLAFPNDGALPHPVSSGIKLNGLNFGIASTAENAAYDSVENGYSYDLVDVTNSYGQTISYRVYRSSNLIGTTIDLDITSS